MAFLRRWLLILFTLILGGETIFAASTREDRDYAAAVKAFHDEMWSRAETQFSQFAKKHPDSTNAPMAVLLAAQAQIQQKKFPEAVKLLHDRKPQAGNLADQYDFWLAEAQFRNGDLKSAAENFAALPRNHPESPLRLPATENSAAAYTQLGEWTGVVALLQDTNGVFRRAQQIDPANEHVSNLSLLLAQAFIAQDDFTSAASVLAVVNAQSLKPAQDWKRVFLLFQISRAAGDVEPMLAQTTNLLQIARLEHDGGAATNLAESVVLNAGTLEKLGRTNDAMSVLQENLKPATPVEYQKQAVLKIAELALVQNQFSGAETGLENFLAQFTNSPAADVALLTLGELYLKDYVAQPAKATNQLQEAQACFDKFLGAFTNSSLAGKVYLDRGWCKWLPGKNSDSFSDFKMAAQKLPVSEDLAVAKFKMGDALFSQDDFSGARTDYQSVLEDFTDFPEVKKELGRRALYQIVRASLELKDVAGANGALAQLLRENPAGEFAQSSTLLFGENLTDPRRAREEVFQKAEWQPSLRAQVALAVARTYEQEQDWPAAITNYENWLVEFPTNSLRPQVEFARAWADSQAGDETGAYALFANFVAQFPAETNLAPQAQWWLADHFFREKNFTGAETNYEYVFQNPAWKSSPLIYPAQLMAGRAAMARQGFSDAIRSYFTPLYGDTNCPEELRVQARFACGAALMQMPSMDTNNPLANFQQATNLFSQIVRDYPTDESGVRAWGEIGDCDLQLGDYVSATNAYAQVFNTNSPADISARSQAQIGFGMALEKKAALAGATDPTNLLEQAKDNYVDVLHEANLRDGETADLFWVKESGLQAAPLAESLGEWDQAVDIYSRLTNNLPPLSDLLGKKIAAAKAHLPPQKK